MNQVSCYFACINAPSIILTCSVCKILFSSIAPTGFPPPPSVTAVTSTTLTLAWEPPPLEQINGIIRNYVVTITEIETGRVFTVASNNTQVTVENLHPFYTYACRVAAETIGVGPYSNQILVQLDEEGKH